MVSRTATDRQILDLQNAESATAWIMSFVAKCRAEKKEDKVNTDGTVQDLQVTNLFLSMCGQDAIIKLRSLMSPRNLIDTPHKDIRLAIQNYISPKERVVTAERAKFLSVIIFPVMLVYLLNLLLRYGVVFLGYCYYYCYYVVTQFLLFFI